MTLDQIRYFTAAAKYEHVGRAAQSIPISASVISQAIKQLEEELNCSLFVRENRKIRLTKEGIRLLELSGDLLAKAEGIKEELGKADLPLSGHYRIGASHFLAAKVIAPVLTSMQAKFPRLTVDVHSQPTWVLIDNILAGRLDFGIGFSPVPHPQLTTEEIIRGNSVVVVRKEHPIFSKARSHHYKLLHEYPGTMNIPTEKIVSARSHPALKIAGLEGKVTFGFDSDFTAVENLRDSDNWAFMIDLIAADLKKYLRVVPVPIPKNREAEGQYSIKFITHKSRRADPAMIEAFRLIKERIHEMKVAGNGS